MLNNARLRIASAMARFAGLLGMNVGPEIQQSVAASKAPRFQLAPPRTRGRLFWDSYRQGTYIRRELKRREAPRDTARLEAFQKVCNYNHQQRLARLVKAAA